MSDVEITAASTEHDWGRMPLGLRARIAWSVLRGRPFAVPGSMKIVACNVTPSPSVPRSRAGRRTSTPRSAQAKITRPSGRGRTTAARREHEV